MPVFEQLLLGLIAAFESQAPALHGAAKTAAAVGTAVVNYFEGVPVQIPIGTTTITVARSAPLTIAAGTPAPQA